MTRKQKHSARRKSARKTKGNSISDSFGEPQPCSGLLELHPSGYGFLRSIQSACQRRPSDAYVSESLIRKHGLAQGLIVVGQSQSNGKQNRLVRVDQVEGQPHRGISFEDRTPVNPNRFMHLEHPNQPVSMRLLDLLCPLATGQRALIAAPPKAGKTTLLKQIAKSLSLNHPDLQLVALLVDERPEEVTEIKSEFDGEVYASCLDHPVESHVRLSELVIDRCMRLTESGTDVVLFVDSLTRMGRAFNKLPCPGPTGAGGLNIRALDTPRRLFASGRAFDEGGSLTIIASVLIETSSRMDDIIFQEFKGTGNLDLVLDRSLAARGVYPAIDIDATATRRSELIHDQGTHEFVTKLRRTLHEMNPADAISELSKRLLRFESNATFVETMRSAIAAA